jgi:hypothetical protein
MMPQYYERMVQEKIDLEGKLKKAKKIVEDIPYRMDKTQIVLLAEQIKYMTSYLDCLNERIEYEKVKNGNKK